MPYRLAAMIALLVMLGVLNCARANLGQDAMPEPRNAELRLR